MKNNTTKQAPPLGGLGGFCGPDCIMHNHHPRTNVVTGVERFARIMELANAQMWSIDDMLRLGAATWKH